MDKNGLKAIAAVIALTATMLVVKAQSQAPDRSQFTESERAVYLARLAERKGEAMNAAQQYTTAISMLESNASPQLNLAKLSIAGEPVPSIGRRMVYWDIKLLNEQLAKPNPDMPPDAVLELLRGAYGKMAWIEKTNPTWPYLQAVSAAADGHYKEAFAKCREAAQAPSGEESVRQKAKSLAEHIKAGALAQEQMKEEDQRAYEEYVRSGAQALDFAMVSAHYSAESARKSGDSANADMWQSRYDSLRKQREEIKIK
jgi:hypothetical protein